MTLRFGPTTNLSVQDTAQLGNNAATEVATIVTLSTTIPNGGSFTNTNSLTVGPYFSAVEIVITVTGIWLFTTGVNADGLDITVFLDTFPFSSGSFGVTPVKDPTIAYQAASQTRNGAFAYEYTFNLAANVAQTYVLKALASYSQTTSTAKLNETVMKVEVIKK